MSESDHSTGPPAPAPPPARPCSFAPLAAPPPPPARAQPNNLLALSIVGAALGVGIFGFYVYGAYRAQLDEDRATITQHALLAATTEAVDPAPKTRTPFSLAAASEAMQAAQTDLCWEQVPANRALTVQITFAPSGEVSEVQLPAELKSDPVGACLQATFKAIRLQPFAGVPQSVKHLVLAPRR